MKLKLRIISCFTLLALLWGIIFSGIFLFEQNQKVNDNKLHFFSKNTNNTIHDNIVLLKFLSEKTEEKNEQTEFQQELTQKIFYNICFAPLQFKFWLINGFAYYSKTLIGFTIKHFLFIEFCSLKLPF